MSLLVVGSMAIDDLETPAGHRPEVIGGAATFAATAASFFAEVQAVSVIGADFPEASLRTLRERGVNCDGIVREEGESFRWTGRYGENFGDAITLNTKLGVLADFNPILPESYKNADFVFLANNDPTIQAKVIDQLKSPKLIAGDTMNFWIEGKHDALMKVIEQLDLLLVNDTEARMLSKEGNIIRAARAIQAMGPKIVVVKRGEFGALLFQEDQAPFFVPAFALETVMDPTGAGDTFAGGLMGYLAGQGELTPDTLRQAMVAGTVLASFTVEGFGLDRVGEVSPSELEARLEALVELCRFRPLDRGAIRNPVLTRAAS